MSESLPGAAARLLTAAGLGLVDGLTEGPCRGTASAWGTSDLIATDGFTLPYGCSWWIDRARFDAVLRQRCVSRRVSLIHAPLRDLLRDRTRWVAGLADGSQVRCSWVVDTTGRPAAVARRLGAVRRVGPRLCALQARRTGPQPAPPTRLYLESVPDGWWYVGASSSGRVAAVAVVRGTDAGRLVTSGEFTTHLRGTRHLARWTGDVAQWSTPRASPAGGAALDHISGDGWVACGDAALAFDPLSSQGLVGALASGLAAADAIGSASVGAAMSDLAARHAEIVSIYEARRRAAYATERRWTARPFWTEQRAPLSLSEIEQPESRPRPSRSSSPRNASTTSDSGTPQL
jgi:flavin-dependent dehydrogenase